MGDSFFTKLWRGTAPLVLWAAHFFFCYLYAAAACGRGTWLVLGIATVIALGAAGWLGWRACRRSAQDQGMLPMAEAAGAVLAFIAIGWGAFPLLVLRSC